MQHIMIKGTPGSVFNTARALDIRGSRNAAAVTAVRSLVSSPGTISRLYVRVSNPPGMGNRWTFTLCKNLVPTTLSCAITDNNTTSNDTINSVNVVAGDMLCIAANPIGAVPNTSFYTAVLFDGLNPQEGILPIATGTAIGTSYMNLVGEVTGGGVLETGIIHVMPMNGTLSRLFINLLTAPGVGNSYTFTVRRNFIDTLLSVVIAGAATTGSDLVNTVVVAPGDIITIKCVSAGAPAITDCGIGLTCIPNTDGEYPILVGMSGTNIVWNMDLYGLLGGIAGWYFFHSNVQEISPAIWTARKLYVRTSIPVPPGRTFVYNLNINGGLTALSVAIPAGAQTAYLAGVDISVSPNDLVDLHGQPVAGGWVAVGSCWGIVCFIAPPPPIVAPTMNTDSAAPDPSGMQATLNGTCLDNGGAACNAFFEWGPTPALGNVANDGVVNTGNSFSATIIGLTPGQDYYFRAGATNAGGTGYGAVLSLHSPSSKPLPEVDTLPATNVTEQMATLNGMVVDSLGAYGSVRFQWGMTTEYGNATPWRDGFFTGATFYELISNLPEGQVIHFRAQFKQTITVSGSDAAFGTMSSLQGPTFCDEETIDLLGGSS